MGRGVLTLAEYLVFVGQQLPDLANKGQDHVFYQLILA